MGQFGTLSGQGFVVEFLRRLRVEGEVKLVGPAKLEARFVGVIPDWAVGWPLARSAACAAIL
jgi:hypothetical protein